MCVGGGGQKGLLVLAWHVLDVVDDFVGVAHLVVVPRHQLDEGWRQLQLNSGLGAGGGLAEVDVSNDDDVDVNLLGSC